MKEELGNQNANNGGENNQEPKEKKGLKSWIVGKYHAFMAKPAGRWTVRVVKGAGIAGIGVGSYILGKRSVKPTTVCITSGEEPEEEPAEETAPAEEENEAQEE